MSGGRARGLTPGFDGRSLVVLECRSPALPNRPHSGPGHTGVGAPEPRPYGLWLAASKIHVQDDIPRDGTMADSFPVMAAEINPCTLWIVFGERPFARIDFTNA